MLTHIVVWKYLADVEEVVRQEHVSRLQRLAKLIPQIETFNVGFDVLKLPRSYDTALVATFADQAALQAYTVHPEHILVADMGRNISEHVVSVDFEDES